MAHRLHRSFIGWLRQRLVDPALGAVAEPRRKHGMKWAMRESLASIVTAMVAGCRSLAAVETFIADASQATLGALGLRKGLADTTARDLLIKLDVHELRAALHRQIRRAH